VANDARSAVEKENSLPNHPTYGRVDEKGVNFSAAMQQEKENPEQLLSCLYYY